MGCGSISNHSVKNQQILGLFIKCQSHKFTHSRVVKITEYGYEYCRGSKSWKSSQSKSIFNESNPVLLSPCQPDQFDELIVNLMNFKQLYPQEFKDFPKHIGMLLCVGDQFPQFQAEILGTHQKSVFEIQSNAPTVFVFWKLKEQITMCKLQVTRRQTSSLFKIDDSSHSYLENAFLRAKKTIKRPLHLIGVCYDSPELKQQYQNAIQSEDIHIWINENDQSAQVFKFAQDNNLDIRTLEQSIFVVNQSGVFVGCLKENFGDPQFLHDLNDLIDTPPVSRNTEFKIEQQIRRDDYQKAKRLITQLLPDRDKKPVGDTFSLQIKKITYYQDYEKVGATYCTPNFKAAGSLKYKQNCDELVSFVKDNTPVAHMDTNFKEFHSLNKKKFFGKLCERIKNAGFEDIRFILEKQLEIFYNMESRQFEMKREITSIHNVPLSISCVYSRKDSLYKLGKMIMELPEAYSNKEYALLKEFFNNPYCLNTSFNIGTLFSPIPNCYKIQHNDFSGTSQINQSIVRGKGIFDSKLVNSVNQSIDIQEPDYGEQVRSSQNGLVLSECWDGDNQVDFNYDQIDTIQQINNEVLIIYLIDYTDDKQIELLLQLLDFIHRNGWQNDLVRVISLSFKSEQTEQFDKKVNRLESQLKKGVLELWFPIKQNFVGVNFNKMLADLYGLDFSSPILVIDHLKRLLYRGMPDQKFAPLLTKIIAQQSLKTIHNIDRPLKHRIDLAQFSREWRIIKQYGNNTLLYSTPVQETLRFLEKLPLKKGEFWKLKMKQFQLWNEKGQFVRKCVEKPQIIYKFERQELNVKFYNIIEELQRLVGKDRIEVIDLNQENIREKNYLLGESLIK